MEKMQWINLLKQDVVPALGCTEPVCVALCAAYEAQQFSGEIVTVTVRTNAGIYKNGMSAGIPHCDQVGLPWAAAIGACLKNPEKQLRLLEDLSPDILSEAAALVEAGNVSVTLDPEAAGLYVSCTLQGTSETVTAIIREAHTNLEYLEKNGTVLLNTKLSVQSASSGHEIHILKNMTIAQIRAMVDTASEEELAFLWDGVEMNEALAAYSETEPVGIGIADTLRKNINSELFANDLLNRILLKTASAAESRLDGCPLPTMSSSGAGTKGLVVILPVSETAKALHASKEKTLRALAFAHLMNRYINAWIGKLSPMCSCVMASSTAASAAIAYLLGGTDEQIGYAIRNMSGTVTGMICDGGKVGCALKVSTGSTAAFLCALTAVQNAALRVTDGICAETPEQCIRNMARVGIQGMAKTDAEIFSNHDREIIHTQIKTPLLPKQEGLAYVRLESVQKLAQNGSPSDVHDLLGIGHAGDQSQAQVVVDDLLQRVLGECIGGSQRCRCRWGRRCWCPSDPRWSCRGSQPGHTGTCSRCERRHAVSGLYQSHRCLRQHGNALSDHQGLGYRRCRRGLCHFPDQSAQRQGRPGPRLTELKYMHTCSVWLNRGAFFSLLKNHVWNVQFSKSGINPGALGTLG